LPAGGGCKVLAHTDLVHTDLVLSDAVAQYGRGVGLIQATAAQIMNQFAAKSAGADCRAPGCVTLLRAVGRVEPGAATIHIPDVWRASCLT
jgi:hypothetical protein